MLAPQPTFVKWASQYITVMLWKALTTFGQQTRPKHSQYFNNTDTNGYGLITVSDCPSKHIYYEVIKWKLEKEQNHETKP